MHKSTVDMSTMRKTLPLMIQKPAVPRDFAPDRDNSDAESATGTRLLFCGRPGEPAVNVSVTINDMGGAPVLSTETHGTSLALKLPDGQYKVRAALENGSSRCGIISVGDLAREYIFSFRDH